MHTHQPPPIAVVAMSGVFPKATGTDRYWHNIVRCVDAIDVIPEHRISAMADQYFNARPQCDRAYSTKAGLIRASDFQFDGSPSGYGIDDLDFPSQWILHAGRQAYEQGGLTRLDHRRISVILAAIALPTATSSRLSERFLKKALLAAGFEDRDRASDANAGSAAGNRVVAYPAALIARSLGLGGGGYTLDAACASSLYAVKLACDQLQAYRSDAVLTGGFSGADTLYTQIGFSQLKALSPSGRCAPFDHRADGLVVGEGVGILVLKRLADALRDGNTIFGIVRGIGLSNDMRGNLLAPESAGQVRAMQNAYTQAGWLPSDVDYIECHGAGTAVGDATELQSLIRLWGNGSFDPGRCALGSIKSMIGHLLTGAGAAGMIKMLLALHHKTLPPSLNFERPPTHSPISGSPFRVQTRAAEWTKRDHDTPRRAAVSAFGFGGINGHILLEEWDPDLLPIPEKLNGTASAFPAACCGVSERIKNRPKSLPGRFPVACGGESFNRAASPTAQDKPTPGEGDITPASLSLPVAIIGMDVRLAGINSLRAFEQAIFNNRCALRGPAIHRGDAAPPTGGYIDEVVIMPGEFLIPPNEIPDILPQQLLMLKTALGAMNSAGLAPREPRERMGAVIGISFDYEATNFHQRWRLPQLVAGLNTPNDDLDASSEVWAAWLAQAQDSIHPPLTASRTLGALGGIVASRIAREFRFGGPSFVVSAEEVSGLRALEIAIGLLAAHECDAVLVGAVDLHCDARNLATLTSRLPLSAAGRIRPFDQRADGTLPGEGAVAMVLKRVSDARSQNDRIFAVIDGLGSAGGNQDGDPVHGKPASYYRSLEKAFKAGNRSPADIGLLECHGSGIVTQDDTEALNLTSFFNPHMNDPDRAIAIGALKPLVGHTGAASGLASVAKTAVSLYNQIVPPMPGLRIPRQSNWKNSSFYFPHKATYWSCNRIDGPRAACTAAMTPDGDCMHVILSEPPDQKHAGISTVRPKGPLGALPYGLFILEGDTSNELSEQLDALSRMRVHPPAPLKGIHPPTPLKGGMASSALKGGISAEASDPGELERIVRQWHERRRQPHSGRHILSILASSMSDLDDHLSEARRVIANGQRQNINGRGGVCYLPHFKVEKEQIAFVYPGSGNHYVGMGRSLAVHWPEVLRGMDAGTDRLRSQMLPRWYEPWRSDWHEGWQAEAYRDLIADPLRTIFGQVLFGCQMTALLQSFNVHPDAVIGYSLGESAGLFATGAWPDRGQMLTRLSASDLFKSQLAGPFQSVRKTWRIKKKDQPVQWRTAVVNRPAGAVDQVIASLEHVRRLIINTPDECVIGGLASAVAQAVSRLGCDAFYLEGVVAVHCDAAKPVAQAYRDLHIFDTAAVPGVRFYSVAQGSTYALTPAAAAESILNQALNGFDFPRCIEQAYKDGVRLFLEVGPHNSCSRMISRILTDRPHLVAAANHRNEDECFALLKCLATLAAAGVTLNLDPLYGHDTGPDISRNLADTAIRVPVGRKTLRLPDRPSSAADIRPLPLAPSPAPVQQPRAASAIEQIEQPFAAPAHSPSPGIAGLEDLISDLNANVAATAQAHEQFLALVQEMTEQFGQAFTLQNELISSLSGLSADPGLTHMSSAIPIPSKGEPAVRLEGPPPLFDRAQCLEFAVGAVGRVLGPEFAIIDSYQARVRLPDEPLMLVDRILKVEGTKGVLGPGRVITEHDVKAGAWYLDGGRAPVCIAVEAGQADLFLSGYLGIDHLVKGERTYRLLDAAIVFHRSLPAPGETIQYDIHIDKFVKQGATYLFFFRYEGFIGSDHLITMTNGCAGFFTEQEVRDSGGIILTDEDRAPGARVNGRPYTPLMPLPEDTSYDDACVDALRSGDAATCFGPAFAGVALPPYLRLPAGRMRLIHRIVTLQPQGGRFGRGYIKAEADIDPEDWFLTCHFVDDKVMPGTLMYECCAHTLRVLLLRMGWVTDRDDVYYEPLAGVTCRLKCRGPVTPSTRRVHYAVEIKKIGYGPQPYVIADAHMYADDHYIAFFKDMSMQMTGLSFEEIQAFWQGRRVPSPAAADGSEKPALPGLDRRQILEFAVGKPSVAFGEPYRPFDRERIMARLPAPPFSFIDRITAIDHPAWELKPSGWVEAQYDVPPDAWYFGADRSGVMPFSVLLEIALQPCGWLAAYAGSALKSKRDLKFRNLGGRATQHAVVTPLDGTLAMRTRMTKISEAADMIIENFDIQVLGKLGMVFQGTTNFGFFTAQALANQVGLRYTGQVPAAHPAGVHHIFEDEAPLQPDDVAAGRVFQPSGLSMPSRALRMIDTIEVFDPIGGPQRLGFLRGKKNVDPQEWFFKAHFFQDPVCPGSLGLEAFLQLIKYAARSKWPYLSGSHTFVPLTQQAIQWQYRGQVTPQNNEMTVEAVITRTDERPEPVITADGWLFVDGLCIYQMEGFGLRLQQRPD